MQYKCCSVREHVSESERKEIGERERWEEERMHMSAQQPSTLWFLSRERVERERRRRERGKEKEERERAARPCSSAHKGDGKGGKDRI